MKKQLVQFYVAKPYTFICINEVYWPMLSEDEGYLNKQAEWFTKNPEAGYTVTRESLEEAYGPLKLQRELVVEYSENEDDE